MSSTTTIKDKPVLTSAPPPAHSVALMTLFLGVFCYSFPSWENVDQAATVETFTNVVFPDLLSLQQLAYIRLTIAAVIWAVSFETAVLSDGWQQTTSYLKGSQLIQVPNTLSGWKTMTPFTSLSWNILGVAFSLSGYIAWKQASSEEDVEFSPLLLRAALVSWEIAAPFTFLVASVIRFAIWPLIIKSGGDSSNLKSVRNIFMHNLNVVFALSECALLGALPVRWTDVSLGPLVGCAYVIFSWMMVNSWNDPQYGCQFIYFFFDTTLPGYTHSIVLFALLSVLIIFYAMFASTGMALDLLSSYGTGAHVLFVLGVASCMMRFRD